MAERFIKNRYFEGFVQITNFPSEEIDPTSSTSETLGLEESGNCGVGFDENRGSRRFDGIGLPSSTNDGLGALFLDTGGSGNSPLF